MKINITIDGNPVSVEAGTTIMEAARSLNIEIPSLCFHKELCLSGTCRICVVEQKGAHRLLPACTQPATDGMVIYSHSRKVQKARADLIELLISEHRNNCLHCPKNGFCELQKLAQHYGKREGSPDLIPLIPEGGPDISSPSITKDDSLCIKCRRCVRVCREMQGVGALTAAGRGHQLKISTFFDKPLHEVVCTNCGQCVLRCPTGALTEKNHEERVWKALADPETHVVVQTAPAVRVTVGELLGLEGGTIATGKMVSALRKMGFDAVFDTNFTADLTIIEEVHELAGRLKSGIEKNDLAGFPMFTSCSPGWIKFMEHSYPEILDHLSSCKSPQQMFGALAKSYYADQIGIDRTKMMVVSVMPCTAKKFEAARPEMISDGSADVDAVLTTREFAHMISQCGIDFTKLEQSRCDSLLGSHTGAGVIFGATGGVMEAALRTAWEVITGSEIPFQNLNVTPVRGMEGVKELSVKLQGCLPQWQLFEGVTLNCAVAHGLANAGELLKRIHKGGKQYHFVEVMACPGGCLGGGGQPFTTDPELKQKRMEAIYREDEGKPVRKSHENEEVRELYRSFLGEPGSEMAHRLLHTSYRGRGRY